MRATILSFGIAICLWPVSVVRCCPPNGWQGLHFSSVCYKAFGPGSFKYNFFEAVRICTSFCNPDVLDAHYKCPYLPDLSFVLSDFRDFTEIQSHIWLAEAEAQETKSGANENDGQIRCSTASPKEGRLVYQNCQNRTANAVVCITRSLLEETPPPGSIAKHKRIVDQVNNAPDSTWKAEYNPTAVYTTPIAEGLEDYIRYLQWKYKNMAEPEHIPVPEHLFKLTRIIAGSSTVMHDSISLFHPPDYEQIPDYFDSREKWPYCSGIKNPTTNQGNCGSCWAVSAAAMISDRTCIHTNGSFNRQLSADQVINCAKPHGCRGGSGFQTFEYWVNHGIVTGGSYESEEGCQPYTHGTTCGRPCPVSRLDFSGSCSQKCRPTYGKSFEEDKHYGQIYYNITDEWKSFEYAAQNMQWEIMQRGPIWAAFFVPEDFLHYRSGVYQRIAGELVYGHAVRIIGWGTENGVPYWHCANSWGRDWGDDGFFKILRGSNHLIIEGTTIGGIPKLD